MTAPFTRPSGPPPSRFRARRLAALVLPLAALLLAAGCDSANVEPVNADEIIIGGEKVDLSKRETVFGTGGLLGGGTRPGVEGGGGIGVNAFLWRASLDTVSIWPINSADPFGGVIITDWYSPPDTPSERFKMNVFILGRSLRADGIRVSLFREVQDRNGNWVSASVQKETLVRLEDAILSRARQIRSQSAER